MTDRARARISWTIGLPLAATVLGAFVQAPGVGSIESPFGPRPTVGVLTLGVLPFVSAYGLVELVALYVPTLARLRGAPEGRAKLDRAARVVGLLFATLQAYGVALSLRTLADGPMGAGAGEISVPLVTATLVGGACACLLAADHVTRQRLVNGPALLLAASGLETVVASLRGGATRARMMGDVTPASVLVTLGVLAAPCVATWYLLALSRRPGGARSEAPSAGPFRDGPLAAGTLPWMPLPLGSLAALAVASRLLAIPMTLVTLRVGAAEAVAALFERSPWLYEGLRIGAGVLVAVTLGRRLAQPGAEATVAERLGVALAPEAGGARRAALGRTAAYFALLSAAGYVVSARGVVVPATTLALLTAVGLDLVRGIRVSAWVEVAEERAAFAPRLLEAALAARGIEATTTGGAVLGLLQGFTPFGGATVLVAEADAERARAVLAQPAR